MKFKSYLLTEGRSKTLQEKEFIKLLKSDYTDAVKMLDKKNGIIYRGLNGSDTFMITDPRKGKLRRSANTSNEYTLLVDNLPEWKDYPKRGRSLICTTNKYYAGGYGSLRIVLPKNGANLGLCYREDFWDCFTEIYDWLDITNMDNFNNSLRSVIGQDFDKNWPTLRKAINQWDIEDIPFIPSEWKEIIETEGTLMKALRFLLDPKNNAFGRTKLGGDMAYAEEVWTDSPCISIKVEIDVMKTIDYIKIVSEL
jgi:hypothetical protein